ncbi:MAG: peptidase T [Erysipelotrichaceae bacterium]|nr:peptidase T [Erysipelotrichaceae bacterium]
MELKDRLIKYVKIDTQSDPNSETIPSTKKQFDLAKLLQEELISMGVSDVILDEHCYVYGTIPSNIDKDVFSVGFIAHMDTSPDYSGKDVNPILISNYDGKDIELNSEMTLKVSDFPQFKNYIGNDILVSDGTTLLGADDKAGIAAIMHAAKYLLDNPDIPHGKIKIGFTPDEEIGRGAELFDIKGFGCDFAYTLDGDEVNIIADENFNAASAIVNIYGTSIHPGSSKNKMVNAINLAMEFHSYLPSFKRPEHTEKREGFNHITEIEGDVSNTKLSYIIRNHDKELFMKQIELFKEIEEFMNKKYGSKRVSVEIKENYENMYEILKDKPEVIDFAKLAINDIGLEYKMESIRGGTDGARLTFDGLPCPNLGTGGGNFHGPYEYCNLTQLDQAVKVILNIVRRVGEA